VLIVHVALGIIFFLSLPSFLLLVALILLTLYDLFSISML